MAGFCGNLFAVLVYYLDVGEVGSWVVVGNDDYFKCTGEMTTVFLYCIYQTSAGLSYVRKVANFFWTGPFVYYDFFYLWWNFIFRICKDRFKGVDSFGDELYISMLKDSSKFL